MDGKERTRPRAALVLAIAYAAIGVSAIALGALLGRGVVALPNVDAFAQQQGVAASEIVGFLSTLHVIVGAVNVLTAATVFLGRPLGFVLVVVVIVPNLLTFPLQLVGGLAFALVSLYTATRRPVLEWLRVRKPVQEIVGRVLGRAA